MNNIDKIKAKIDRLYDGEVPRHDQQCDFGDGYFRGIATIENFIDSMSEEKPSEDLEEEIKNYFEGLWPGTETAEQCNMDLHFTPPAIIRLARHFTEWQKQRDAELIEIAYKDGITIGKTNQKEQMMKDAVEGEVENSCFGIVYLRKNLMNEGYSTGDKVKLIIVKED